MTEINRNIYRQEQPRQYATVATMTTGQENFSVRQRQLIPTNFVQLESQRRNNIGSAEEFDNKPGYERYYFFYKDKRYYLDISFELVEQLGLTRGQNCEHTIYVSNEVLNRNPEEGGITIDNREDIIIVRLGTILEREMQTDLTAQGIGELKNNLTEQARNIQELNARINALQEENTQTIERLIREKNELQGRLNETNNNIDNLQINLENEQETNQNLQVQSIILRAAIIALKNQVANLTIERDNKPNISLETYNNLVSQRNNFRDRYLNNRMIINNTQVVLGIDDLNNLPALLHGENLNSLLGRPTRGQLNQIEQEREIELDELNELIDSKNAQIVNLVNERDRRPNLSQTEWDELVRKNEVLQQQVGDLINEKDVLTQDKIQLINERERLKREKQEQFQELLEKSVKLDEIEQKQVEFLITSNDLVVEFFSESRKLTNLKKLTIRQLGTHLDWHTIQTLISESVNLEYLLVSVYSDIPQFDLHNLTKLKTLYIYSFPKNLTMLDLSNNKDLEFLVVSGSVIQYLDLSNTKITRLGTIYDKGYHNTYSGYDSHEMTNLNYRRGVGDNFKGVVFTNSSQLVKLARE